MTSNNIWSTAQSTGSSSPLQMLSNLKTAKFSSTNNSSSSSGITATAQDTSTDTSSTDSSSSSTISANDFLTLLVTEMQNQDPTADQDPNEYINQLVNVNSLEQLISINQTLTDAADGTTTSTSSDATSAGSVSGVSAATTQATTQANAQTNSQQDSKSQSVNAPVSTAGNMSIPSASKSSLAVANALNGMHAVSQ